MQTAPQDPELRADVDKIKQHLDFLFGSLVKSHPEGMIEISVLNKSEYFPVTQIEKAAHRAAELNNEGKNVYTTPSLLVPDICDRVKKRNEETGKSTRARAEDFLVTNIAWLDVDDLSIGQKDELRLLYDAAPPNYYSITYRGDDKINFHLYWDIERAINNPQEIEEINKGLIKELGGDKGTHNCTRLMKLGGSVAWPSKKGRVAQSVDCSRTDYFPPHAVDTLKAEYVKDDAPLSVPNLATNEIPPHPIKAPHKRLIDGWTIQEINQMLDHIDPDCDYADWIAVGMALKDQGVSFQVWDSWSGQGSKYQQEEMRAKWESFQGSGTSFGTVVHMAQRGGWQKCNTRNTRITNVTQSVTPVTQNVTESVDQETGEIHERRKLPLVFANEVEAVLEVNDFIEDLLCDHEFSVVYGESNCGKTFFMLDVAMHVALGRTWRTKQVEQGGVVYLALEGGHGTKNRIAAFIKHYNIDDNIPLAVIPTNLNFMDIEGDFASLIEAIEEAGDKLGRVRMIVIDTLARAIAGGDENSNVDMGMLVRHADLLRERTGAHICFVHHSGKDQAKGARGHSSLRAAVDTEIEISREEGSLVSKISVAKQREMAALDDMYFELKRVVLGENRRFVEVSSCVVVDTQQEASKSKDVLNAHEKFVFDAIMNALIDYAAPYSPKGTNVTVQAVDYFQLASTLENMGYRDLHGSDTPNDTVNKATLTARMALKKKGYINFDRGRIWVVNEEAVDNWKIS